MGPDQQGQQYGNGAPAPGQQPASPPPPLSPLPSQAPQYSSPPNAWQPTNNDPLSAGGMPGPLPTQPIIRPVKQGKGKLIAGLSIVALLLVGGAAAAYQFLYVPNTPAAIFKTGMQRSGETLEQLTNEAAAESKLQALERTVVNGTVVVDAADTTYNGKLVMSSDLESNDTDLAVSFTDESGKKTDLGLQVLMEIADGNKLPDAYFKLKGLKALGLDGLMPGLGKYDDQWVGLSAKYLQQLLPADTEIALGQDMLTAADVSELSKVAMTDVRKYVLTDDPAMAVLQQKRFVGTEQLASDITANRYVVSINKANAKKFCEAIVNDVSATKAFKKLPGYNADTVETEKKDAIESCQKEVDDTEDGDNLELWIDTSYKLISKIRLSDPKQAKSYVEFGQSFKGGDDLPLFMALHDEDEKADGRMDMVANLKQSTSKSTFSYAIKGDDPFKLKLDLDVKPGDKPLEIQKPAKFTPLENVLKELGLDGMVSPLLSTETPVET